MSAETDLVEGLATLLDNASIGVYSTSGAYQSSDVGIIFGDFAQEPSQQIVLTSYIVQDSPAPSNNTIVAVQVMLRGTEDPRSVKDRSALIFEQFHGLGDLWFGDPASIYLATMWRQTGRLDGRDDSQRWLSAENYYARTNWPTGLRTD